MASPIAAMSSSTSAAGYSGVLAGAGVLDGAGAGLRSASPAGRGVERDSRTIASDARASTTTAIVTSTGEGSCAVGGGGVAGRTAIEVVVAGESAVRPGDSVAVDRSVPAGAGDVDR